MKVKFSEISNIIPRNGQSDIKSSVFDFLVCLMSQYLIDQKGLDNSNVRTMPQIRAYFKTENCPPDAAYHEILASDEDFLTINDYLPRDKKDFDKLEKLNDIIWEFNGDSSVFHFGQTTFNCKNYFLNLRMKDNKYYAQKANYYDENCYFRDLRTNDNEIINSNPYLFIDYHRSEETEQLMNKETFFQSCKELSILSEEQRHAVTSNSKKNLVILAGAGSGKTRTLSARYLYTHFCLGVPFGKMMLVTYTKRAKESMQDKTADLFDKIEPNNQKDKNKIKAYTIDAYFRQLLLENYGLCGFSKKPVLKLSNNFNNEYLKLVDQIKRSNNLNLNVKASELEIALKSFENLDSKLTLLANQIIDKQIDINTVYNFSSITRIIYNALERSEEFRTIVQQKYQYVFVDEFQDIDKIQDKIFSYSYQSSGCKFTFVGDDDQSIYLFRGADDSIIRDLTKEQNTETAYLTKNFRNNPNIVFAGNSILKQIDDRAKRSDMNKPVKPLGSKIKICRVSDYSTLANEVITLHNAGIPYGKIAFIARKGPSQDNDEPNSIDLVKRALDNKGIPNIIKINETETQFYYDFLKFTVFGIIDRIYAENFLSDNLIQDLSIKITPAHLYACLFGLEDIQEVEFGSRNYERITSMKQIVSLLKDFQDSSLEEVVERFCHEKKIEDNNLTFSKLKTYSINNRLNFPCRKNLLKTFFDGFEQNNEKLNKNEFNLEDPETVKLTTIHSVKGLEFEVVFIVGLNEDEFPNTKALNNEFKQKEEALNNFKNDKQNLKDETENIKCLFRNWRKAAFRSTKKTIVDVLNKFKTRTCADVPLDNKFSYELIDDYQSLYKELIQSKVDEITRCIQNNQQKIDSLESGFKIELERSELSGEDYADFKTKKKHEKEETQKEPQNIVIRCTKILDMLNSDIAYAKQINVSCSNAKNYINNIRIYNNIMGELQKLEEEKKRREQEEMKLFYVAITRAITHLYLCSDKDCNTSPFINNIPNENKEKYSLITEEQRRTIEETDISLKNTYKSQNTIDEIKSNQIVSNFITTKDFNQIIAKHNAKFFKENEICNYLTSPAMEILDQALSLIYLEKTFGFNYNEAVLHKLQRCAEEFISSQISDIEKFPRFKNESTLENAVNEIYSILSTMVSHPTNKETIKSWIINPLKDWKNKLKPAALGLYLLYAPQYHLASEEIDPIKNIDDCFLKACYELANARNEYNHNYHPIYEDDLETKNIENLKIILKPFTKNGEIKVIRNDVSSNSGQFYTKEHIYKSNINKVLEIKVKKANGFSLGTGFHLGNGCILTNEHVIEGGISISGNFVDSNSSYELKVIKEDKGLDLAVLKCDKLYGFKGVTFYDGRVNVGEKVFAIGNTDGQGLCFLQGNVTKINEKIFGNSSFRFDAQVSHGNSGGPVFNKRGLVVGVVVAGNMRVSGMNYALTKEVIDRFLKNL